MLRESIRKLILVEIHARTFDWIATLTSRAIIDDIHASIGQNVLDYNKSIMSIARSDLRKNLADAGIRDIEFNVKIITRGTHIWNVGKINTSTMGNCEFNGRERKLYLSVMFIKNDIRNGRLQNLETFIPILKSSIRHELEHSKHPIVPSYDRFSDASSIQKMRAYHLSDEEIEATAVELHKRSRSSHEPLDKMIRIELIRTENMILSAGATEDEAKRLLAILKFKLVNYIKQRYQNVGD